MDDGLERLLEGLFLIVPAFLATRLLVLVAPHRGRMVARRILAWGIPATVLFAIVGFVSFAEGWPHDFDAMGFTALIVTLPLGIVWLGSLVVRAARWPFRRKGGPAAVPRSARVEGANMAAAGLGVAVLVGLVQWGFYRDESRSEAQLRDSLQRMLRALEVTANKLPEFEREAALLEAKTRVLDTILPETLGVPEFMDAYRGVCRQEGFRLAEWRAREIPGELQRAEIDLVVEGPPDRLKTLGEKTRNLARLTDWTVGSAADDKASAQVTIYAQRRPPWRPATDACATAPKSSVWLWPLRSRVRRAHEERARLCAEIRRLDVVRRQVDAVEADRGWARARVEAIERLRAAHPLRQAVPPPPQTQRAPKALPADQPRPVRRKSA